jgi:hypothetical protein
MACHEVAALRLGLMRTIGICDDAERQHEIAELGCALEKPGPLRALASSTDLENMARMYAAAVTELSEKVARTPSDDPKLAYVRSLMILTRKVELDLRGHIDGLTRFYRELEEMHDFVHEIYPAD